MILKNSKVYIGITPVAKIYRGDTLIYDATSTPEPQEVQYYTDWEEFTVGDILNDSPDWRTASFSATNTYTVVDQSGNKVIQDTNNVGSGDNEACAFLTKLGLTNQVEIFSKCKTTNNDSSSLEFVLACTSNDGDYPFYRVDLNPSSNTVRIRRRDGIGSNVTLGSQTIPGGFSINELVNIVIQRNGANIKLKVWKDGDIEPVSWLIDITDGGANAITSAGLHGIHSGASRRFNTYEVFSMGVNGNIALRDSPNSFIENQFVLAGNVTETSFSVSSKLVNSGSARLAVYDDVNRTNLVQLTPLVTTNSALVVKFNVEGLQQGTRYYYSVVTGGQEATIKGSCKTFPSNPNYFKLVASSCSGQNLTDRVSNHVVYDGIRSLHDDAEGFMQMGDIHYLDIATNDVGLFRNGILTSVTQPRARDLYSTMWMTYKWDDHDFGPNNSSSESLSKPAVSQVYREMIPANLVYPTGTNPICETFVIGDVRIILIDPRSAKINGSTMLGELQKQWLKQTLLDSLEPVIGICTSVPWIGDGSGSDGNDHWASTSVEREELANFFIDNGLNDRIFLFAGDAHMIAIDNGTNSQYATGGFATHGAGPPVFQFAALDANPSIKGGPYSEGAYSGRGQFGTLEFTKVGENLEVKGTGYSYLSGVQTEIVTYTKSFPLQIPDIIVQQATWSEPVCVTIEE
jgi:hypothetical protein